MFKHAVLHIKFLHTVGRNEAIFVSYPSVSMYFWISTILNLSTSSALSSPNHQVKIKCDFSATYIHAINNILLYLDLFRDVFLLGLFKQILENKNDLLPTERPEKWWA